MQHNTKVEQWKMKRAQNRSSQKMEQPVHGPIVNALMVNSNKLQRADVSTKKASISHNL